MRSIILVRILLCSLVVMLSLCVTSSAGVAVVITVAPPPLPVYVQPPCPAEGYIWVPGYWAYDYDFDDYYWVPGTWVMAPEPELLWTPPYWAWNGTEFVFYQGYWGPQVGFYGGINYGFGYFGEGYQGGRWKGRRFYYNRAVTNVNTTIIHNVYNTTVINNTTVTRVSYNGGDRGIHARPTAEQEAAAHERHLAPVASQTEQVQAARADRQLRASVNFGKPQIAATPKPGAWHDREVVAAERAGGEYKPARMNRAEAHPGGNGSKSGVETSAPRPSVPVHARDLPPRPRPEPPNTGNAKQDRQYQQQQEKLRAKQEQEQTKLEQKQERDDRQLGQRGANEAKKQQMEKKHQQQTQQLEQKQSRDLQKLQEKQQSKGHSKSPKHNGPPN
jgi:WXXGXW repeat (2 copies)